MCVFTMLGDLYSLKHFYEFVWCEMNVLRCYDASKVVFEQSVIRRCF
jgi:hypothetical protein